MYQFYYLQIYTQDFQKFLFDNRNYHQKLYYILSITQLISVIFD